MLIIKSLFMYSLFQPYRVEDKTGVKIPTYFMIRYNKFNALYPHVTVPYQKEGDYCVVRDFHITFSESERVYFVQKKYGVWEYGPECTESKFDDAKPIAEEFNKRYLDVSTSELSTLDFTKRGVYGSWR